MHDTSIEQLVQSLRKLPGLGPRSARRIVLQLIRKKETLLEPLLRSLKDVSAKISLCEQCGNLDSINPCNLCNDPKRDGSIICIVEDVADLWALERTSAYKGHYYVLGGTLSALDGIGPSELKLPQFMNRVTIGAINEIVLALSATVDGQTTAHYIAEMLSELDITVSAIAHGVPIGGELDYLDEGTLSMALNLRRPV